MISYSRSENLEGVSNRFKSFSLSTASGFKPPKVRHRSRSNACPLRARLVRIAGFTVGRSCPSPVLRLPCRFAAGDRRWLPLGRRQSRSIPSDNKPHGDLIHIFASNLESARIKAIAYESHTLVKLHCGLVMGCDGQVEFLNRVLCVSNDMLN